MTTHAPVRSVEDAADTAQLEVLELDVITDALPLLDHRTRARTIFPKLAPRGHYLAFEDGDQTGLVPLDSKITHIGRGLESDLRVDDQRVSRDHAIIVLHGRYARVLDNRSSHGTFVNGRRVVATNLNEHDVIQVGPVAMRYVTVS